MTRVRDFALIWSVVVTGTLALIPSARAKDAAKTGLYPEYVIADTSLVHQTKSNVTIDVEPLGKSRMYDHPELFAFKKEELPEAVVKINYDNYYIRDWTKQYWGYTFGVGEQQLTAFRVSITNNTDHILRMKDARIYLEVEGEDPVPATTTIGDATLVPSSGMPDVLIPVSAEKGDNSLIHGVTFCEAEAERTRKKRKFFDHQWAIPIGVGSQIIAQNRAAYKLISNTDAEILPGRTLKGLLLFRVFISYDTATLSFFDIHTQTDAAGNATEKQTFSFPLTLERVQVTWDDKEKRWKRMAGLTDASLR